MTAFTVSEGYKYLDEKCRKMVDRFRKSTRNAKPCDPIRQFSAFIFIFYFFFFFIFFFTAFYRSYSWINAVSASMCVTWNVWYIHGRDEREGEKEDDFEGDSILTIAQWERDARSTSNESIRAQDSLVHVYAFIHISRAIHRKTHKTDGHILEEALSSSLWEERQSASAKNVSGREGENCESRKSGSKIYENVGGQIFESPRRDGSSERKNSQSQIFERGLTRKEMNKKNIRGQKYTSSSSEL